MAEAGPELELVIVDDEPRVAKALERELRLRYPASRFGIGSFEDPARALAYVRANKGRVFLVISDLRMPGMGGAELLEGIRRDDPDVQTTLLTAFSDMDEIRRAVSASIRSLLGKPWDQASLFAEVEAALAEFRLRKDNERMQAELRQQLRTAGEFQGAILGLRESLPAVPALDLEYRPLPLLGCGGDFYDAFALRDGRVVLLLGDVSGHGIKPALVTVMLKTLIQGRRLLGDFTFSSPSAFLSVLNVDLCRFLSSSPDTLVALAAAFYEPGHKQLRLANAGLPELVLADRSGVSRGFSGDGPALAFSSASAYGEHTVDLNPGDSLAMHTVGLVESEDEGRCVGADEARELLATMMVSGAAARPIVDRFMRSHRGGRFSDDVTLLVARFPFERGFSGIA